MSVSGFVECVFINSIREALLARSYKNPAVTITTTARWPLHLQQAEDEDSHQQWVAAIKSEIERLLSSSMVRVAAAAAGAVGGMGGGNNAVFWSMLLHHCLSRNTKDARYRTALRFR